MDWTSEKLTEFATGYWGPGALLAAVELGIFGALGHAAMTADDVTASIEKPVSPQHAGALLDALVASQFLVKTGDRYSIVESARPLLLRESQTSMLGALRYNADLFRQWGDLSDALARSESRPVTSDRPDIDPAALRRFVYGMESKARALAPAIANQINLTGAQSVLDVGSGPGTLSRCLAQEYTDTHFTLLDLPPVLAIADEIGQSSPARWRIRNHPADYHIDAFPTGFDVALFAGALHQEPCHAATRLAEKLFYSVNAGGTIYVIDIMLDPGRVSPAFATLFQLNMLLSRPDARVYSFDEVAMLLSNAGFVTPQQIEIPQSIYRIVKARKPEVRS